MVLNEWNEMHHGQIYCFVQVGSQRFGRFFPSSIAPTIVYVRVCVWIKPIRMSRSQSNSWKFKNSCCCCCCWCCINEKTSESVYADRSVLFISLSFYHQHHLMDRINSFGGCSSSFIVDEISSSISHLFGINQKKKKKKQ